MHRKLNPKSWWWGPEIDFLSAMLHSSQLANWQRGGGKGPRPKMITRPREVGNRTAPKTLDEARARKKALSDELARRRERRKQVSGDD